MMFGATRRAGILFSLVIVLAAGVFPSATARQSKKKERVHLVPRYSTGEVIRYGIQLRTNSTAHATGPIVDPEGATQSSQSVNLILRLDVLPATGTANGEARLRATYEKVTASSQSNSYDPHGEELQRQYEGLQGHSIEFTLQADGKITDIAGLEDVVTDATRAAGLRQWLGQITLGSATPRKGIAIGEKWSSWEPVAGAPLSGVEWHTRSTYQSNEPCIASGINASSDSSARPHVTDECAMILTRSETHENRGPGDRTPSEFKKNGLHTSGEWKGTGETLTAISLNTGMVVSVTQSATTHMDFTVTSDTTGSQAHYTGKVQSEAQMTLLPGTANP